MRSYIATTGRELSKSSECLCYIFGAAFVLLSILKWNWYSGAVGLVLLAAAAFRKTISVNEEGILIEYRFIFKSSEELWRWEDIKDIFLEYPRKQPGKVAIHFTKENLMARRLLFDLGQKDAVLDLALEKKPDIKIY